MQNNALIYLRKPSFDTFTPLAKWKDDIMWLIERCIRVCYKSEDKMGQGSDAKIIKKIIDLGHDSTLEHFGITVNIICSRYTSHQLVRHRIGHGNMHEEQCTYGFSVPAVSQESQRWCNYKNKGFQLILPTEFDGLFPGLHRFNIENMTFTRDLTYATSKTDAAFREYETISKHDISLEAFLWLVSQFHSCETYLDLMTVKKKPEIARTVLSTATKTEMVCTYNIRQWRNIFMQRAFNPHAQREIKEIMRGIWMEFYNHLPVLFGDLANV